jgi:bacterioferritin (cytochrome b1)
MSQDDSVETIKGLMTELLREKNGLVERLNAMQVRIEEEDDLVTKVLLKVEWMAEKERHVDLLNKVLSRTCPSRLLPSFWLPTVKTLVP